MQKVTKSHSTGRAVRNPDSKLLSLIRRYEDLDRKEKELFAHANKLAMQKRAYKGAFNAFLAVKKETDALENAIALLPAKSSAGVAAKLGIALLKMDYDGSGMIGSIWQVPVSAVRDALRVGC